MRWGVGVGSGVSVASGEPNQESSSVSAGSSASVVVGSGVGSGAGSSVDVGVRVVVGEGEEEEEDPEDPQPNKSARPPPVLVGAGSRGAASVSSVVGRGAEVVGDGGRISGSCRMWRRTGMVRGFGVARRDRGTGSRMGRMGGKADGLRMSSHDGYLVSGAAAVSAGSQGKGAGSFVLQGLLLREGWVSCVTGSGV